MQHDVEVDLAHRIESGDSLRECVAWLGTTSTSAAEALAILENFGLDRETAESALMADPNWAESIRLAGALYGGD
jgi:hypothetical protein